MTVRRMEEDETSRPEGSVLSCEERVRARQVRPPASPRLVCFFREDRVSLEHFKGCASNCLSLAHSFRGTDAYGEIFFKGEKRKPAVPQKLWGE